MSDKMGIKQIIINNSSKENGSKVNPLLENSMKKVY